MYVCKIYNAPYVILDDSFARREIQLAMGWQCGKNECVFSCFLKLLLLTVIGSSWKKCTGRLFQIIVATKLNERFAVSVRLLGTSRSDLSDDLSDLTATLSWRSDARYTGSPNWRMLKFVTAILNFIRYSTDSQWSENSTGRMCSYFLVPETMQATAFCAICNLWIFASDIPTRRELQ